MSTTPIPITDDSLKAFVDTAISIRVEITRLMEDRALLLTTLTDMEHLRRENAALKASVAFLMREGGRLPAPHSPMLKLSTLPLDIVHHIFEDTIPPQYLYDPSVVRGPGNPWLQILSTKKALPLICTELSWLGMATLYKNIVLRRMGQISALANTLRSSRGPAIAFLIRSIDIEACPVSVELATQARKELTFIFRECRGLRSVAYRPHPHFPILEDNHLKDGSFELFNPTWIFEFTPRSNGTSLIGTRLASNLQRLILPVVLTEPRIRGLHDLLCTATSLRSLTVGYSAVAECAFTTLMTLPVLQLPYLHELYIHSDDDKNFDTYVSSKWEMPTLVRLTIFIGYWKWPGLLLQHFGAHLLYLHLYPWEVPSRNFCATGDPYPDLSICCPKLEHLVAPNPHLCDAACPTVYLHSQTIKHVDFWEFHKAMRFFYRRAIATHSHCTPGIAISTETLPSLESVRLIISYHTGNSLDIDWPTICHPTLITDDESNMVIWHKFPDVWVAQTNSVLLPADSPASTSELPVPYVLDTDNDSDSSDSSFSNGSMGSTDSNTDTSEACSELEVASSVEIMDDDVVGENNL